MLTHVPVHRRSGRAVPLADQGRHQGRPARRHVLRGPGLPLHRAGRRAQHPPVAEVPGHGPASFKGPVLLHVVTEKGHGFQPAAEDPTSFHAPAPFARSNGAVVANSKRPIRRPTPKSSATRSMHRMRTNPKVVAITAAMCQGTCSNRSATSFPSGSSTWASANRTPWPSPPGWPRPACGPIVDIYSTFMQRSYDQIFQEVALQNLPVTLLLDRAGLVGPDGPTHHGVFDLTYLRPLPNLVVMAPGDAADVAPMLDLALAPRRPDGHPLPQGRRRNRSTGPVTPIELGKAEVLRWGRDGMIIACGTLLGGVRRGGRPVWPRKGSTSA